MGQNNTFCKLQEDNTDWLHHDCNGDDTDRYKVRKKKVLPLVASNGYITIIKKGVLANCTVNALTYTFDF